MIRARAALWLCLAAAPSAADRLPADGGHVRVYVAPTPEGALVKRDLVQRLTRATLIQPEARWRRDVGAGADGLARAATEDRRTHRLRSAWWAVVPVVTEGGLRLDPRVPLCVPALVWTRWPLPDSLATGAFVPTGGDRYARRPARAHVDGIDLVAARAPAALKRNEIGIERGVATSAASQLLVRHRIRHDPALDDASHRALRSLLRPARFRSLASGARDAPAEPPLPTTEGMPPSLIERGVRVFGVDGGVEEESRRRTEALLEAAGVPLRPASDSLAVALVLSVSVSYGESVVDALEERDRAEDAFPEWTVLTTSFVVRNGRDVVGDIADPSRVWLRPLPSELPDVRLDE